MIYRCATCGLVVCSLRRLLMHKRKECVVVCRKCHTNTGEYSVLKEMDHAHVKTVDRSTQTVSVPTKEVGCGTETTDVPPIFDTDMVPNDLLNRVVPKIVGMRPILSQIEEKIDFSDPLANMTSNELSILFPDISTHQFSYIFGLHYGLRQSKHIKRENSRDLRGWLGIKPKVLN